MPAIKQNNQAVKTEQLRSKKDAFSILDNQVKIFRTNSKIYQFQLWIKEEQKGSMWFIVGKTIGNLY